MNKVYSVQQARGWAAAAVVFYHVAHRFGGNFEVGQAGVDVFFVISGFIIWSITEKPTDAGSFLRDRLVRIAPMYWLATLLMLVGAALSLFPNVRLTLLHTMSSFLFWPTVSPSSPRGQFWPLLVQGWTLNYEMFFYVLFAGLMWLPRKMLAPALIAALGGLVALGAVVKGPTAVEFFTQPIILEFAAGVLLGVLYTNGRLPKRAGGWMMLCAGLSAFALIHVGNLQTPRVLFYGLPALLIVAGLLTLESRGVNFNWRPGVFLGDASYAMYLFHTFAVSVAARIAEPVLGTGPAVALAIVGGIAIGPVIYLTIERPLHTLIRARVAKTTCAKPLSALIS